MIHIQNKIKNKMAYNFTTKLQKFAPNKIKDKTYDGSYYITIPKSIIDNGGLSKGEMLNIIINTREAERKWICKTCKTIFEDSKENIETYGCKFCHEDLPYMIEEIIDNNEEVEK